MGSILMALACSGRDDIPVPLPNAIEFQDLTPDRAAPLEKDAFQDHEEQTILALSDTDLKPLAFVRYADGNFYPARADINIKCPDGNPAFRLSDVDYGILSNRSRSTNLIIATPRVEYSNPSPLIESATAFLGSPKCYDEAAIIPYKGRIIFGGF